MIKVGDCALCQKAESKLYNILVKITSIHDNKVTVKSAREKEDVVLMTDLKPSKFKW